MAVEHAAEPVDDRRDRLEDDRADRDRLDEVPVTDVEVEDAHARLHDRLDLLAEPREVGRVERRLDLGGAHPFVPAHRRIFSAAEAAEVFLARHAALPLGLNLEQLEPAGGQLRLGSKPGLRATR